MIVVGNAALQVLTGMVLLSAVGAMVMIVTAITEEKLCKRDSHRDPLYDFSIRMFLYINWVSLIGVVLTTASFLIRLYNGLPGSMLPGPEANTISSFMEIAYGLWFAFVLGIVLLMLVRRAHYPDERELAKRRVLLKRRLEFERLIRRSSRQDHGVDNGAKI
jgi:uncharacterized membrane protein